MKFDMADKFDRQQHAGSAMYMLMGLTRAQNRQRESQPTSATFESLYRTHVGAVFGYAVTRVGRAEAEDITAEVFQAAARVAREGNLSDITVGWLMTVARNKVVDHWRRMERRERRLHLFWGGSDTSDPSDALLVEADRDLVLAVLERISKRHRLLLIMHYVDGMPTTEIADVLGISISATESALARARRSFRAQFDKQESKSERL